MQILTKYGLVINEVFKQDMLLYLPFFLDTNSVKHKIFENLAIWVQNLLNRYEIEEGNYGYKKLRRKTS